MNKEYMHGRTMGGLYDPHADRFEERSTMPENEGRDLSEFAWFVKVYFATATTFALVGFAIGWFSHG